MNALVRFATAARLASIAAVLCGLVLAGAAPSSAAEANVTTVARAREAAIPVASAARVAGDAKRTRLVIDLSDGVEFGVFPLADPYRIVIDLPEARFAFGPETGHEGRGLISAWRYGLLGPGKSRVVVDLAGPAAVDRAFMLPPVEDQPARLVIDLVAETREAFVAAVAQSRERRAAATAASRPPAASRTGRVRPLVILDPGHGGIDKGAVGVAGTLEKTVTLEFAKLLEKKLAATGEFDVRLTRDDDVFIALDERVEIARAVAADLFVSIHADSAPQAFVRGSTVYTVSDRASDAEAAAIAAQENRSDVIAGVDLPDTPDVVTDILVDLARRETRTLSNRAADVLVRELGATVRLNSNPHRHAGFRVLRAHDIPSVLVELGYLTNRHDEALMLTQEWRDKAAESIIGAVDLFFAQRLAGGTAARAETTE
jgi:N-acetylmuramoyl-L-alanine amidase